MKILQTELPDKLYEQVKTLVDEGWFCDEKDVLIEALRRFIETRKPHLMEKFIKEDVEWGLSGTD
jgi:Arc/MetJ-type ribon-helix-helix transcriptional regulator